ncbi:Lsr2 family protein [Actinophytocola sp.]|jgi:nucleoid-associated protein Lsr2|uniref:histone-like nucleoid-structuring protein Lsr2 n=1 Tax=Actinophytocola sp. TaxID=1872138 RepID=UPI002D4E7180|nr:Lsr2 family protein [Actinophytocola sp.]HYQ69702.1 Lsr2 family protein [Actinophytocola sp.]
MAQQVLVQLVDDLDGTASSDVSTVSFALDGVTYEIDLSEANAERLRGSLVQYVESARRVGGRLKRGSKSTQNGSGTSAEAGLIRAWANENGYGLSGRGRIPSHVVEAYKEAKAAEEQKAAKPAPKRRTRAKK